MSETGNRHSPTRLPYGLSFVKVGANSGAYTLESSATPNVQYGTYFQIAKSALTITQFLGGERGKIIYLYCNSGNCTTIQNSAGGINIINIVAALSGASLYTYSSTAGNAVLLNKEVAQFVHNGTDWSYVGLRNVLSTL